MAVVTGDATVRGEFQAELIASERAARTEREKLQMQIDALKARPAGVTWVQMWTALGSFAALVLAVVTTLGQLHII